VIWDGQQRTEISHRADAEENQGRVDAQLDTKVKIVKQARLVEISR
jgi:hypothetical protein